MKTDPRLCVVSADGRQWSALSYGDRGDRNINFKIRTYLPGALDGRLTPLKSVSTIRALARHLTGRNRNSPVIAKVAHVKQITGWREREFAPVL